MPLTKTCPQCGYSFAPTKSRQQFCSRECSAASKRKALTPLTCAGCGKVFLPKRSDRQSARYCSHECYLQHNRAYKQCPECGKLFFGANDVYCSRECVAASQRRRAPSVCLQCGKPVEVKPSQLTRDAGRFCSPECVHAYQKAQRIQLTCDHCGKEFEVIPSQLHYRTPRFCSSECAQYRERAKGELAPGWKGGKSFEPYPPTFTDHFKRMIRERDGMVCAVCRLPDPRGLHVHHINYVKEDTTPENCISLCCVCHGKTHHNRTYWQATLSALLKARLSRPS